MKRISLLLALGTVFISSHGEAQEAYGGASVAITQWEDDDGNFSFKGNPYGVFLYGGIEFQESFAFEVSYINSGRVEFTERNAALQIETFETDLSAYAVSLLGLVRSGDNSVVHAKLGVFAGEQRLKGPISSFTDDDSGLTLGIGFRYELSDNLSLRGDFDWYDTSRQDMWSMNFGLRFGFDN